jgi:hypothetical protein
MLSSLCFSQSQDSLTYNSKSASWALGVKGSTIGYGVELTKFITSNFCVRVGWNHLSYSGDIGINDFSLDLDYTLDLGGPAIMLDYYLFKGLYISGGVLYNNFEGSGELTPEKIYQFNEIKLTPEQIGYIRMNVKPDLKISPYLGIGFGKNITKKKKLYFNIELGTFYHGKPKANLYATQMLAPSASEKQINQLNKNLEDYSFYPFLSFQLSYVFFKK